MHRGSFRIVRNFSSLLITGGAGFIGSTLVSKLLERDEVKKITILDRMIHREARHNLTFISQDPRVQVVEGDLREKELTAQLLEKSDFTGIFHLATETRSESSLPSPMETTCAEIASMGQLLSHAKAKNLPLILCSSAAVYGSAPFPEKFSESTPLSPTSLSAASEAAHDLLALASHKSQGVDVVIARSSHCYGPGQDREKLIPKLIYQALRDEALPIHGSGRQIRDWMHVDDCALGLIACFAHGRSGAIYHLGSKSEHTNLGIARTILKQLGKPESLISHTDDRSEQDERQALDTRRALQMLQWKARTPFRSGLEKTVRELAAHLRPTETEVI